MDGTFQTASFQGCGCAGGEVVTLTDEMQRRQKVYSDSLGRQWKTEVLDTSGNVYSATATTFNARDQVTAVNSYKGAATSNLSCPDGTCMQALTTYDGYGHVATQKLPQQTSPTTYAYYADDTLQTVTDPRGVSATNSYNARHLLTGIGYQVTGTVPALGAVSYSYDAAGNRTSMSDSTGSISYAYNDLSRLTSETRTFSGLGNSTVIRSILAHSSQDKIPSIRQCSIVISTYPAQATRASLRIWEFWEYL